MDLSIIIPVHDEDENVAPLLEELLKVLRPTGRTFEVIAVDDGSTDGTLDKLRELSAYHPEVKVVALSAHSGKAAALDAGLHQATGQQLCTLDADLQSDPADIPKMVAKLDEGYDLVSGTRRGSGPKALIGSRALSWLVRRATGTRLQDFAGPLKLYRRELVHAVKPAGEMYSFLGLFAEQHGARLSEVEVAHRPRRGAAKLRPLQGTKTLLDLLAVWLMRGRRVRPLHILGVTGLCILAVGAVLFWCVVYERLRFGYPFFKNPLFLATMLVTLLGSQLLAAGMVLEVVLRSFFEKQNRPAYAVAEKFGFGPRPTPPPVPEEAILPPVGETPIFQPAPLEEKTDEVQVEEGLTKERRVSGVTRLPGRRGAESE